MKAEVIETKLEGEKKRVCYEQFDNIDELVNRVKHGLPNKYFRDRDDQDSLKITGYDDRFHDYRSLDEATEALEYGTSKYFKDFEKQFKKAKDFLAKKEISRRVKYRNDVVGFAPIVPNVIVGAPVNMVNSTLKPKAIPTAKMIIEKGNSAHVKLDSMLKYYTLIFALVQLLEQRGIRCEVWVVESSKEHGEILEFMTKIKDYNQPLNVYKIQFPIIASDFLRRIAFRVLETSELIETRDWCYGYGSPLLCDSDYDLEEGGKPNENLSKVLRLEENDVYIPSNQWFDFDKNDNLDTMLEQIIDKTLLNRYIILDKE